MIWATMFALFFLVGVVFLVEAVRDGDEGVALLAVMALALSGGALVLQIFLLISGA